MMDDKERDAYLLEILDRLARLETKFDEQVDVKHTASDALEIAKDNRRRVGELERKEQTNRNEKRALWLVLIGGLFTLGGSLINVLL
jgi:hypothetical protein